MADFVELPVDFFRSKDRPVSETAGDNDLYFTASSLVRFFFWMRLRLIHVLMKEQPNRENVLDFGGGIGIFLPTLARTFAHVVAIDRFTADAEGVRERYDLRNVSIVNGNIATTELDDAPFSAIVAADVLEHFNDLEMPVSRILAWLRPGGVLYTSLPTESWFYALLRKVFGKTKPADHYHTAAEVEACLASRGLHAVRRTYVPIPLRLLSPFALFRVTAWKKN